MPGAERREPHPAPAAGDGHNTADDDARSTSTVASTIATTASLSSRIAALAADFDDKLHAHIAPGIAEVEEQGNEVREEVIEITEEELLTILDAQEDPLELCSRLFFPHSSNPVPLQRLEMSQVEDLRQHGYVVIDGFLPQPEVVSCAFQETLRLVACERLTVAAELPTPPAPAQSQAAADKPPAADAAYTDRSARGDHIMFLHPGQAPACTPVFAPLMLALQELQNDLSELMHLRRQTGEFQLAFYPGNGAAYAKHRDALPDDGSEEQQRRVTAILYLNPSWQRSHGGELRLWPPAGRRTHEPGCRMPGRDGAASAAAAAGRRRSGGGADDGGGDDASDAGSQASSSVLVLRPGMLSSSSSVAVEPSTHCGSQQDADSSADGSVSERPTALELGAGLEWGDDDGNMVLDVAPLGGRLVLFLSGAVDHAVRPCSSPRVAVTAWLQ